MIHPFYNIYTTTSSIVGIWPVNQLLGVHGGVDKTDSPPEHYHCHCHHCCHCYYYIILTKFQPNRPQNEYEPSFDSNDLSVLYWPK